MAPNRIQYTMLYRSVKHCDKSLRQEFLKELKKLDPKEVVFNCDSIHAAFIWQYSPQGYDFWLNMSRRISIIQ